MKEMIKLIYRFLIVIVSAIALYLNFELLGFKEGIIYFTNLSNLLCFVYFIVLIIMTLLKKVKRNDTYYIIKGMVTMAITITMFIYNKPYLYKFPNFPLLYRWALHDLLYLLTLYYQ